MSDVSRPPRDPDALEGTVTERVPTDRGFELAVRLHNTSDRALHYIADVRAIRYDPATQRLVVRLSDEGRMIVPGAAMVRPQFRHIDPNSEAEIRVPLPETVFKLAQDGPPTAEVAFETQRIADAVEIEVDIGWSEIPFYEDPRPTDDQRLPAARWQQAELAIVASSPEAPASG